ncbi:hypothetical protein PIB30_035677 [Stylosanthes scabra]|uniref:Transposase (Putative), gypsy type n=1 Tax=Stylosanthes scabra TaxID=79078 RepID=A0ABU6TCX7_9FABA|nr:hypothetical protein [Stylosanthes scabra]
MAEIQGNDSDEVVREVEQAQMPHEPNPLYDWVNRDVLGSPCTMTKEYLTEMKNSGVIFGGGEEENHYRVELPRPGERVCELNLDHPRVPHWLWVNEVMFTEFGVRIPFSPFQQRLLQRCFVAPSQFHPNVWSAIRCFELVTEFLELPQDPEVFLYLFTVFSPNAEGKAKKGYMSVRPGKGRKIFGLYEDSFHDFKGRYFKVFAVGNHPPFWLTLERDAGRFPSYWSKDAGVNYTPSAYRKLNEEQRDTADILLWLFSQRALKPKAVLGNTERARATVVKMAGKNKTLANLKRFMMANPQGPPALSPSAGQTSTSAPEGGSSSNVGEGALGRPEVSSPIPEEGSEQQIEVVPASPLGKRARGEEVAAQKRPRTSEGPRSDFCRWIGLSTHRRISRAISWDYDPMESIRWAQWAMLRSATIMKSVEPRLTVADQWERRCAQLTGDLKLQSQQKADLEKEKGEAELVKSKVEKDLEIALGLGKEKDSEIQRLRDREVSLLADLESVKKRLSEEKVRADKAEASLAESEEGRQQLIKLAQDSVQATEDALKEQILVLAPSFDVSLLGAWKEVVDGQIVDPPPPEGQAVDPPPQD